MTRPIFMVAVDGSVQAHQAFEVALTHSKLEHAHLVVVAIVEHVAIAGLGGMAGAIAASNAIDSERSLELKYRKLLASYALRCQDEEVPQTALLGTSSNIGKFLVHLTERYGVQCAYVGRSGMGAVSRFLLGSVSSKVVNDAKCNVMVVRGTGQDEEHVPIKMIQRMEERERQRRQQLMQEHRGASPTGAVMAANLPDPTRAEEEAERVARTLEHTGLREHSSRLAILREEEAERKRRQEEGPDPMASQFRKALNANILQLSAGASQQQPDASHWVKHLDMLPEVDAADPQRAERHAKQAEDVLLRHDEGSDAAPSSS